MRIDLDVRALQLREQVAEIRQIVPRHEDARPLQGTVSHHPKLGLAEMLDMRGVQELHDPQVLAAQLQRNLQQALHVEVDVRHGREQRLLDGA